MHILTQDKIITDLIEIFGENNVFHTNNHLVKVTPILLREKPKALINLTDIKQLNKLLILLRRYEDIGITPWGFGSSPTAYSENIIISLGDFNRIESAAQSGEIFTTFTANPYISLGLFFLFILLTVLVVMGGVSAGIERWSKILMPILFLLLILFYIPHHRHQGR